MQVRKYDTISMLLINKPREYLHIKKSQILRLTSLYHINELSTVYGTPQGDSRIYCRSEL
jgi:hypothetical protein